VPSSAKTGNVILLLATVAFLYFAQIILIPLAFALTFAFLLNPAVELLQRAKIPRIASVILTLAFAVGAAALTSWTIANQLLDIATQLPRYQQNIHRKVVAARLPTDGALVQATKSLQEIGDEISANPPARAKNEPNPVAVEITPRASGLTYLQWVATPVLKPLATTVMVLVFTIFILIEREDLRNRLLRLAGLSQLNLMTEAIDDGARRVSRYLLMQFVVNAVLGAMIGIGLYIIGVPNAGLWGAVAAVFRIVPYVGTAVAALLPIALSLAVFDGWSQPLSVFLLFAALELVTANVIEPWLYGSHTGISSLALLVTAVFWAALWGPAGLVLSTPLTVCLVVVGRYAPQLGFLHILLGDEPVLGLEAQLYQRLLAMDQQEARVVVDRFLKDRPLSELYDEVLIPALTMAEHDRHRGAIDAAREDFLFLNINEMVAEFSEYSPPNSVMPGNRPRVLCLPAHDQADEITAAMIAQLLEQRGCIALSFPIGPESEETLALVEPGPTDLICISALPPFAFNPARTLCRNLRSRFPGVPILVGVWGFGGDPEKALARFDRRPPDRLFTKFSQMIDYICVPEPAPETESMSLSTT
jgi:predicted PurR-regulated permease PerM